MYSAIFVTARSFLCISKDGYPRIGTRSDARAQLPRRQEAWTALRYVARVFPGDPEDSPDAFLEVLRRIGSIQEVTGRKVSTASLVNDHIIVIGRTVPHAGSLPLGEGRAERDVAIRALVRHADGLRGTQIGLSYGRIDTGRR